eukprot:6178805-Pleurochrysis_carterae.AAC.1
MLFTSMTCSAACPVANAEQIERTFSGRGPGQRGSRWHGAPGFTLSCVKWHVLTSVKPSSSAKWRPGKLLVRQTSVMLTTPQHSLSCKST